MMGTSTRPSCWAAMWAPWPARISPFSSTMIGLVQSFSLMLRAIWATCSGGWVRVFLGLGLMLSIGT